jgi:hypothetical protein
MKTRAGKVGREEGGRGRERKINEEEQEKNFSI